MDSASKSSVSLPTLEANSSAVDEACQAVGLSFAAGVLINEGKLSKRDDWFHSALPLGYPGSTAGASTVRARTITGGRVIMSLNPDQLGVQGAIALLEALYPVEALVARRLLSSISVDDDDRTCRGQGFEGDALSLFALVAEMPRESASAELQALLEAGPDLAADIAPQPRYRPLLLDAKAVFPVAALPPVLADLCSALDDVHSVSSELAAAAGLGALSGCLGKALEMPSFNGLTIMPNLYVVIGAPSSAGKSLPAGYLFGPLHEYQSELIREHRKHSVLTRAKLDKLSCQLAQNSEEGDEPSEGAALDKLLESRAALEAALRTPRFVIEDATTEAMIVRLDENGGFSISASADAKSVLSNLAGRHRNGSPEDDVYLKSFSGDTFYQDRISRASAILQNPRLVIAWLTQHRFFDQVFLSQALEDSGFACRFLAIRVERGRTALSESTVPETVVEAYKRRLRELLVAYVRHDGPPLRVAVDSAATKVLHEFRKAVNEHTEEWELPADLLSYPRRWAEIACKLALVLHAGENGNEAHIRPLCEQTARNAVKIMTWFAGQQEDLLKRYVLTKGNPKLDKARSFVEASGIGITARDLARHSTLFKDTTDAAAVLEQLVREGKIRTSPGSRAKYYERLRRPGGKP